MEHFGYSVAVETNYIEVMNRMKNLLLVAIFGGTVWNAKHLLGRGGSRPEIAAFWISSCISRWVSVNVSTEMEIFELHMRRPWS